MHLESLEYSVSLDLNIDIFVISDKVEKNKCKHDLVIFQEFSEFYSFSQNRIEHVKDSVQVSTEEIEVFDEAWLFGKVLWTIILQKALRFIFSSERFTRGYQYSFKLVKHSPLC